MIGRTLGVLALVTSAAFAAPWFHSADTAGVAPTVPSGEAPSPASPDPLVQVQAAIEAAATGHIPGARGSGWVLQRLDQSDEAMDGTRRILAHGVIAAPGGPGTQVQISGRYDPATGLLDRVNHRLQAPEEFRRADAVPDAGAAWSVQLAVQRALAQAVANHGISFALDSAQSLRLDDGGRRFEGHGIGLWGDGEPRFVTFTLRLSPDGEPLEFDYGIQAPDMQAPVLADN